MKGFLACCLGLLTASQTLAQAVTQWQTAAGVMAAVIETPGGDLEHVAVVLPLEAELPASVADAQPETVVSQSHKTAVFSLPARMAAAGLRTLAESLSKHGAWGVVALGPAPVRELEGAVESLVAARGQAFERDRCAVADGGVEVVRGANDAVEVIFAAPPPSDPRFELLQPLAAWLQRRLAAGFPGARADVVTENGCGAIVVQAPAINESSFALLARLRASLVVLVTEESNAAEVAAIRGQLERRRLQWAFEGRTVAQNMVERLAAGGRIAGCFATPIVEARTLMEAARLVLLHRQGFARVVEAERRPLRSEVETLENGVQVTTRATTGELATVALSVGGGLPEEAAHILHCFSDRAAERGWFTERVELIGIPAVSTITPPSDLVEALEILAGCTTSRLATAIDDPLLAAVARQLGLSSEINGARLSLALEVAADADEAREAAAKFFAAVPPGNVTSQALHAGAALRWDVSSEPPRVLALVDVPASPAAVVAACVLMERLKESAGVSTRWISAPGRLVLLVGASGGADLPALDAQLEASWLAAKGRVETATLKSVARGLVGTLQGDLLRVACRRAAARFLSLLDTPDVLLAVDEQEVNSFLVGLPRWEELQRFASGPAPRNRPGNRPTVRESAPRPQGR